MSTVAAVTRPSESMRVMLRVFDAGYGHGLRFDAVIGAPDVIAVAHHRHARGVVRLLADGQPLQASLWETRRYERVGAIDGDAWYEPEGWRSLTGAEIARREMLATRR